MKQKMTIATILCYIAIAFVIGCSEDQSAGGSFQENLYGKWQWVYTNSKSGHSTPITDGINERFEFGKNGLMYNYVNDTLSFSGQYEVVSNTSSNEGVVRFFDTVGVDLIINIDKDYRIIGDSLFIRLEASDYWESSGYSRIR